MIRIMVIALALTLTSCIQIIPTPDDFPPPGTVIVEFPTPAGEPTLPPRPRVKPLLESDMSEARAFFLVTKTASVAGDDQLIAQRILYPIQVRINGQAVTIHTEAEFIQRYRDIFDDATLQALWDADDQELARLPDGIRAADGLLWFNRFCMDTACTQTEFLITKINK